MYVMLPDAHENREDRKQGKTLQLCAVMYLMCSTPFFKLFLFLQRIMTFKRDQQYFT